MTVYQHSLPAVAVALLVCSERVVMQLLDVWTPDLKAILASVYGSIAEGTRDMWDWKWQVSL
jgi:hypothetical protein